MKYYKSYIIKLIVHLNIIISLLLTPIAPLITQIPNLAPFQFGQLFNLSKITKIINNIISTIPKQFELISDSNINTDHNIVENEYYIFLPLIVKNPPIDPIYGPDLAISVSGSSLPINPGDDIYFTITYSNLSDIQASGVYIQAFLPDLTNFNESASSPGWTQVGDTNEFRFFLDSIPPLEADLVSFVTTLNTFIPAGIDYVESRFEIHCDGSNGLDPNPINNRNITRSFIEAFPDLGLLINAETPYFYPGSQQDFLITYSNNGNQGATGIELIAYLPEYTMFNPEDSTPGWVLLEDIQIKYKLVIENLGAFESDIAVFSVIVNEDLPEGIDNISLFASVYDDGSNGEDPNEEDNQSEDEVPFSESPDLALNKSANFDSVYPGSILIYSLSYTNLGISEGNNVVIDEILPENTTFDPIHSDSRWDQIDNTNQFILNLGSIAHEESGTVDFAVNIDLFLPDDILEIVNSASISDDGANGLDPDLTNNEAQLSISIEDIELPPELSVTVNDGGQAVEPGGRIIYQIHFINQGDLTATNVLITANQPLYTVFDPSQSSSGWDFNDQNQQYEYIIPTLEEGGSGDCEFAVVVSSPAPTGLDYVNGFFSISDDGSHGDDPLPSNNQFSTSTIIEAAPDLSVDIDDPEVVYVKPGDNLAFIVSYANIGNQDATNIYIDAQLPVHSIFDEESSTPGWSFITEENAYRFIVETLDANNQETLIFAIAIENETSPELTQIIFHSDIADDGSNGEDHNPSNNQDQSSIPYSEAPDLSITKSGPGVVVPGISVVYSLTYSNLGFTTSNNAVITETIPQYTTFNEALSDPAWVRVGETNQYSFSLSSLSGGSGGKIAFAVTVDPVVPDGVLGISNIASISDDGLGGDDPDLSNNSVTIDSLFSTGPTNVCGSIAVDTTWTPAESPYVLTCDVTINSGVTLDILPGTIIKFNSSSRRLIVNGNLHALGSSSARIYFTSYKDDSIGGDSNGDGDSTSPAPGDWNTILINDTGTASFNYSDIRYGGYSSSYYANLYLTQNANVSLVSSAISNSYYYGIRLSNSTSGKVSHLSVVGSVIEDKNQRGI